MDVRVSGYALAKKFGSVARILGCVALLALAVLCAAPRASAQVSAEISGTVTDPSSAAVANAAVTAKNVDTGASRATTTDGAGHYQILSLPLGEYEVRVSKSGFADTVHSGIHLVVGQDANVGLPLTLGSVNEAVTVQGDAPPVSVTTNDISGLVGEQQVKDLPLNGRSVDLLVMLNPGVVNFTFEKTGGTGVSNSTNGNNFAVAGNRPQQNLFLLNGVEYTGAAENNMQPASVSGELLGVGAFQEFNILRDTYGAEYGKRPGGQVSIVTQSGTNQSHGSVYEFLRNNDLDARNFFDFNANEPADAGHGGPPKFQRNQFGVSGGGAIQKDKTFVFGNYEGLRQNLDQTSLTFVPANDARANTFAAAPWGSKCAVGQQVACAATVGLLVNDLWPAPNGPELLIPNGTPTPTPSGIAPLFSSPLQTIREDFGTARVDHIFSQKDSLSAVYTIDDGFDNTATPLDPWSTDLAHLREQVLSLEETHVFSPALLNTARFGYSRAAYFFLGEPTPGTPAASLSNFVGAPGSVGQVGAVVVGGSTASNPATQLGLAGSNNGSNLNVFRNIFTYQDQVTLTHGRHQFNIGAWFQQFQSNENLALSQYGQASFGSLNALLGGVVGTFTYDPTSTEMNWRSLFAAWYAEDIIRVTPTLTVSLGFRAESSTGWNEAHGRAANYVFSNGVNGIPQVTPCVISGATVATCPTHIGDSAFTVNNAKFLAQPRLAVAWSPFGARTVIRAGFGMYNDLQDALGYRMDQNAPFNPTYAVSNLPVASFPAPVSPPPFAPAPFPPSPAAAKLAPGGVQPDLKPPTLISWSLRVQQELSPNTSLAVGYIGSHGYHEMLGLDANEPAPVLCTGETPTASSPCPATFGGAAFGGAAQTGFNGTPLFGMSTAGTYFTPAACAAGNPNCTSSLAGTWTWFGIGTSSYNALEVDLNRRFGHGFSVRGVYTWSKALDDGDSLNGTTANNAPGLVSNPFNLRTDKGPATYNATNVGVINAIYELPIGHGKMFAGGASGWEDKLVGGWSLTSVVTLQSGLPFTPQLGYNPSLNGDTKNPVRPFLNPAFSGPVVTGNPNEWFNPAAFVAQPTTSGFYGNVGRDTFIGPGLATWDFSVVKNTAIHERLNLQFRAEIFNLLNRANFNTPNLIVAVTPASGTTPLPNPAAGQITSTSTTARQVQFGLKLLW